MSNYQGDPVILTTTFKPLTTERYQMTNLSIRNGAGNSICQIGRNTESTTGWLGPGESREWQNISPSDMYVKGVAGQIIHWDGDGSLLGSL